MVIVFIRNLSACTIFSPPFNLKRWAIAIEVRQRRR